MSAPTLERVEGVPPTRGYRLVYLYELKLLRRYLPKPLAAELDRAAAESLAKWPNRTAFKFWPAPSQASSLAAALGAVRQ